MEIDKWKKDKVVANLFSKGNLIFIEIDKFQRLVAIMDIIYMG
jgi:hypothetical protein